MTLEDLISQLPLSYAQGSQYGLVFDLDIKVRLEEIQQQYPPKNYAVPRPTTTGRYVLNGNLLSEVGSDGMFNQTFSHLDSARFAEIDVISWEDAVNLLPKEDPI